MGGGNTTGLYLHLRRLLELEEGQEATELVPPGAGEERAIARLGVRGRRQRRSATTAIAHCVGISVEAQPRRRVMALAWRVVMVRRGNCRLWWSEGRSVGVWRKAEGGEAALHCVATGRSDAKPSRPICCIVSHRFAVCVGQANIVRCYSQTPLPLSLPLPSWSCS